MLNPNILEVVKLKFKISGTLETPNKGLSQLKDISKMSLEDDYQNFTPRAIIQSI